MLTEIFLSCLCAYTCGSIPFGLLLAKKQSINIREHGSGNIGATNVTRILGKKAGLFTLAGDVFKGWFVVFLASLWFGKTIIVALAGLAVFLGHLFSIFLNFKGGKGVATYVGILCCLDIYLGFSFFIIWIITFLIFKYSSLSSLLGSLSIPIINFFIFKEDVIFFFVIMFVLIFYTHRENIKRLLNRKESKTKIY